MRRPLSRRARTVLVLAALAVLAVMALPGLGRYAPPQGTLPGRLQGPDGRPVRECRVALFDGTTRELLEVVHSDRHGRFAFRRTPASYHLFANPAPATGLIGAWRLDGQAPQAEAIPIELERGRLATIEVRNEEGEPVPDVEVRAYRIDPQPRLVVRSRTDASGEARLVVPARAHLAALPGPGDLLAAWAFDRKSPESGTTHVLELRRGRSLEGRVVLDDGRTVDRAIVSSWDEEPQGWCWNGYTLTDETGTFRVPGRGAGTELRAVAPERVVLPARRVVRPEEARADLTLRHGLPLELFVADVAQRGRLARVWFWSEDANTWSWGERTDDEGRVLTTVSELFSVVADPVAEGALPSEAWDRVYEGPQLKLVPGSTGR